MFSSYRTIICLLLLAFLTSASHARTISSSKYDFTIEIPDQYTIAAPLAGRIGGGIYAFQKTGARISGCDCIFILKQMFPIAPGHIRQTDLPRGADATLFTARWQGVDIDCVKVIEHVGRSPVVTFKALLPLKDQGIEIWVTGYENESDDLRSLLTQLVASTTGEVDPEVVNAAAAAAEENSQHMTVMLASLLSLVAAALVFWVIHRSCPSGTLLAIAVFIYVFSYTLPAGHDWQTRLIQGLTRMIGSIGVVWGGIEKYRSHKQTRATPPPLPFRAVASVRASATDAGGPVAPPVL